MKIAELSNNKRFSQIIAARERISPFVHKTGVLDSIPLGLKNGGKVYLKLENTQITGSFKVRGAFNKVLSTPESDRSRGFICASSGNHGLGFAEVMDTTGHIGTVCLPLAADRSKVQALEKHRVQLEFHGHSMVETELYAQGKAKVNGTIWVSPYNDPLVIAGQGTIGMELTEELDDVDSVLICAGGGGLIAGVGTWFKQSHPQTRIVACLPTNSPELYLSIQRGQIVSLENPKPTLSDGSAGGLEPGSITFEICKEVVDDYILVTEEEISRAIKWMMRNHGHRIEGAAGVALGAFFKEAKQFQKKKVVVVICGGNISDDRLNGILAGD